jgi:hypothetical protein
MASQATTERAKPRAKLQGGRSRRGRIQGRGARKAKATMCVRGADNALAHHHPDPIRWPPQRP